MHPDTYTALLAQAPAHESDAFIDFLREHNTVVEETPHWIVIENHKYHSADKPWLTVFWKHTPELQNSIQFAIGLQNILHKYPDWTWLKKSAEKQTVKRFHIHLYRE